ncbi:MAG: aldo/keto reductase [Brachybacterium sp.]|uniref:aldo/keto reductase n=1 Tax=Brachybacterium sp. TaxID=1891286 RepID=UPI0026492DF3|nr:aldo/keto reductase [Brachybacterium sp.]MDN5685706.1 aldo/keto reductase [Brachybacterium sp.]
MTTPSNPPLSTPALSIPTTSLADGSSFPLIGFGTSSMKGRGAVDGIAAALNSGYRLLDTAAQYGNEAAVGEAVRVSGVDPDDVLVTTKIAGGDQGREATRTGFLESLRRLGLPRAALVLIHWPNPSRGLALETWRTLIDLKEEGKALHIGVSNFRPEQLTELVDATGVWPEVNQIQLSPALQRGAAVSFHREHGILTEAWGPLGGREGLDAQFALRKLAEKHGATASQISLRWAVDQGVVVIPKSSDPQRQRDNATLDHVRLDDADRELLATLDLGEDAAWDSREHEEW